MAGSENPGDGIEQRGRAKGLGVGERGQLLEGGAALAEDPGKSSDAVNFVVADKLPIRFEGIRWLVAEANADKLIQLFECLEPRPDNVTRSGV